MKRFVVALIIFFVSSLNAQTLIGASKEGSPTVSAARVAEPVVTWQVVSLGDDTLFDLVEVTPSEIDCSGDGSADNNGIGETGSLDGGLCYQQINSGPVEIIAQYNAQSLYTEAFTFGGVGIYDELNGLGAYGHAQHPVTGDGTPNVSCKHRKVGITGTHQATTFADRTKPHYLASTYDPAITQWNCLDSTDGTNWNLLQTETIVLTAPYYAGIYTTSSSVTDKTTSEWDNIQINSVITILPGGPAPPPPPPPPGSAQLLFSGDFETGNLDQWHVLGDPDTVHMNLTPGYGLPDCTTFPIPSTKCDRSGNGDLLDVVVAAEGEVRQGLYSSRMTVKNDENWTEPDD